MDTLDKYLIRELIIYFVLVLIGISALAVGIDFLSKFWSAGIPFGRAMEIYLYKIPKATQQFVPVAALMATLLVLSTMSRSNEILALYASGVSPVRIVSTFIAAIATLSTVTFLLFDPLLPLFEQKKNQLEAGKSGAEVAKFQADGSRYGFWYRSNDLIYHVGTFNPKTNTLQDLDLYFLGPEFQILKKIRAKEAKFEDGDWSILDGVMVEYPLENPFPKSESFKEIRDIIRENPSDYQTVEIEETTMRLRDLRKFIERSHRYGVDMTVQRVSYHERVAHVFSPLIFVLLGLSFSLSPFKNQSPAKGVALSFLLVFVYLILSKMSLSVGRGGRIPPMVAAWLPNMLFLGLAGVKLVKK
ncbi:MAG: YjgP/YjgQ family permease [Proteobacteria bacterium]|nr:YjgP/YjgQ family permease [Pseudomonadota bacterium]